MFYTCFAPVAGAGCQDLTTKFLDGDGGVGGDVTLAEKPIEEPANGDQTAVHGGDRLPTIPPQMIPEVGDIPGGDPADTERLLVGRREPGWRICEGRCGRHAGCGGINPGRSGNRRPGRLVRPP